ncbi:unnamed protein product [Phytophthora lilii]|uniref:Unnamed protein product n=1 Tax=Phytophthora lilii TaxID=2077276 RepID=A0A9W6U2K5_9STRA|nr:unnamed protein product [Phytophthora lilii]
MQTTTARPAAAAQAQARKAGGPKAGAKKKKPQDKPRSNGKEAGPAGPRPVAPPPVSGPWGNPKPATGSAPPPGFAPSPPKAGFSDAHQRLLRHRALFAFRFLVGKAVELQLAVSEERYAGVLDCVDPDDFSVVLKNAKRLSAGSDAKPFEDGSTVIFRRHQLAHLVADGTVNYTDGVFASAGVAAAGFRTDTEISGQKGEHLYGRELEAASSWLDPALDTGALEDSAPNGRRHGKNQGKAGWNQFEANEKLFGVVSTYDENIYTTKLDKTKISTEQSRAAERLAQEIERQSAAGNFHLQEERGQTVRGGKHANDLDEEARYSSVDRGASASGNAYVPPALRNAQRQSIGDKSQAKSAKTPPTSSPGSTTSPVPADAEVAPPVPEASTAPPAAPTAPKPLSFSEAVTGRSVSPAAPVTTAKAASKTPTDDKKGSPKKAATPAEVNNKDAKPAATKSKGASPKKKDAANGKEKKTGSKTEETNTESKSSTTTTTTTKQLKDEAPKAAPKKGLNPNAKEFKLNASAAEFTPSFAVPPAVKENVPSPYRGGSPGHMPYPHPGMGYPPPMQEEWMYDGGMAGEDGGEMGMPPYIQAGYGMPVAPNGVPMMYPPMMPQQNMRMMGGQRGGYGGYQQQGYNPRGYYSPPNGGYPAGGMPYPGAPGMPGGVGPQPPLPREPTPSSDASPGEPPADGTPAPPVPEAAPERRGSGVGGGFVNDSNRKQTVAVGVSSPNRVGYPENQLNGILSAGGESFAPGLDRMADRVHALERENEHFREELQHLRHYYSSNQQQHENDKLSVGKIVEDLQRLAQSFNTKLQADMGHQQREQQKAALLFAEVSRIGHRVEGLESELRGVIDDIHRKFEAQDQHAQFLASVSSKQQQVGSPGRTTELQRQLRDMQDAMVQLRSELDADRSSRWKNDAAVDAKLDAQLERINSKMTADKRDLARALDEQRQLVTGADFQRVTSHMREFSRVNDHLLALERWLHSEFGQIKRVFQALAGDVDARFQCVLVEIASGLKVWHAAQVRQEDAMGVRFHDMEEAVREVAIAVQRKLQTLEEVIPLEVQARQKNDDKLKKRVEGVVKALGHAIETSREEYLPQQSILAHRLHQLELNQKNASDEVSMQHHAMRETIQAFMEDSDAMLVRLAAAVEQERMKGFQSAVSRVPTSDTNEEVKAETARMREKLSVLQRWTEKHSRECSQLVQTAPVAAAVIAPAAAQSPFPREDTKQIKEELAALRSWADMHAQECRQHFQVVPAVEPATSIRTSPTEEMQAETTQLKEELVALQAWTAMHAQECRQFIDFLSWSMDDTRRDSAVMQCLDTIIDQIVEAQTREELNTLANGVNGALRQIAATPIPVKASIMPTTPTFYGGAGTHTTRSSVHLTNPRSSLLTQNSSRSLANEDATDMLDLSTTTYYASTDGDVRLNNVQTEQLGEDGECGGGQIDPQATNTTDFEAASASMQQLHINEEDEYSMDMTHDEEPKEGQPVSVYSSPASGSQGNWQDSVSMEHDRPASSASPKANAAEEEPLILDL